MNIWDFQNLSQKVKLTTKEGKSYTGWVLSILDTDDQDDAVEPQVCMETSDGYMGFWESEIQNMEIIDDGKG